MLSVFYDNSYASDLQSRSYVKKVQVKPKISTGNSVVSSQGVVTANVAKNIKILNSTQINNNHIASKQKINSHKPIPNANHAVVKNNTLQNIPFKPYTNKSLAIFAVDAETGRVLFSKQAYEKRYPASLTKLMTMYVLFDKLDHDKISLNDKIYFSKYASSKPPSKLGVHSGQYITVREAISATIVLSANDVATAIGEHLAGSEANFSRMMNVRAKKLKMYNTNFSNASGLFHPAQRTTAADMVKLGVALQNDFPQYYKYFSETNFNFRGRAINGHNSITANYDGATGLKTGYISQSGFNLISSASRDQKRVFATVLGGKTAGERDLYMRKLLDASFLKIDKNRGRV